MRYQNKEIYIVFAKPVSQWPALIQHLHVVAVRWHQKPFSHQREKYIFCSIGQQQKVEGRSRLFIILETCLSLNTQKLGQIISEVAFMLFFSQNIAGTFTY